MPLSAPTRTLTTSFYFLLLSRSCQTKKTTTTLSFFARKKIHKLKTPFSPPNRPLPAGQTCGKHSRRPELAIAHGLDAIRDENCTEKTIFHPQICHSMHCH
uniref:(northern house mosquito) hypothetical protein n=1 Tax=Culex pipiens TaxID=7175 RepID=A0A8D8AQ55_CULPI